MNHLPGRWSATVQEGPDIHSILALVGGRVGRSALFAIPLQQTWSYEKSGD